MAKNYIPVIFLGYFKRAIIAVLLMSALITAGTVFAGETAPSIPFRHLSIEEGLSQTTVQCIVRDHKGFIWFGTQDGLNRYDGYTFSVYRHDIRNPGSLRANLVWSVYEDRGGTLWVGTIGGLDRYDRDNEKFIHHRHDPDRPGSLSHDVVRVIFEDRFGVLWIGTDGGGLDKFDREKNIFVHYRHDPADSTGIGSNKIRCIYEEPGEENGVLWVGTFGGGLNKFDRNKETFSHYRHNPKNPRSLSGDYIRSIRKDSTGVLWVGTDGSGLNKYNPGTGDFTRYRHHPRKPGSLSHNRVRAIFEDGEGVLWLGTGGGLDRYDRKRDTFIHYRHDPRDSTSLSNNSIWSICRDHSGLLWIGTINGLSIRDPKGKRFSHYKNDPYNPNSLSGDRVRAIWEEPGETGGVLWVGTDGGGLNKLDRKKNRYIHYRYDPKNPHGLAGDRIRTIYKDRTGIFWIGTFGGGLNRFDPRTETFTRCVHHPDNPAGISGDKILSFLEDRTGMFWIGTYSRGLNRFDHRKRKKTFTHFRHDPHDPGSLSDDWVWVLYEDRLGVLWAGTSQGLNKFDGETETFTVFKRTPGDRTGLSSNSIRSICEDRAGVLWIGTRGGLNKFNREEGTFTHYLEKDGLPNDKIFGILEDEEGYLWLSTTVGLCKFNPRTGQCRNFDKDDGLQSNEFKAGAYFKSSSGEMFFGGITGFNAFYPSRVKDNPHVPPIVITNFKIFNEHIVPGKGPPLTESIAEAEEVRLSHTDYVFSFEFAALDYTAPQKNRYAYRMEGFEEEWNHAGNRRLATYTNLSHGEYVFRVKGSNNDGVWNEEGAALRIVVLPPFWLTWWFKGLVVIMVLVSISALYLLRTRRTRGRTRMLESQVEERTLELQREIGERKQAEEDMRHLRNLLKNIVDSMPSMLVGVDAGGRVIQWNLEAERVTGIKWEDAKDRILSDVFPRMKDEMEKIRQAIRDRAPRKHEKVAEEVKGTTRFSDVAVYPLIANCVEGAVIRIDDVTDRVRMEEMIIQSEKMMSVGGLAAGMAHEINNPLGGIIQNTLMILNRLSKDHPSNHRAAAECGTTMQGIKAFMEKRGIFKMLNLVKTSGERAAVIVENMLGFSRKGDEYFRLNDLVELLNRTVALASSDYDLKHKYDFRAIEIVREFDTENLEIPCEGAKIQQVFLNILKNGAEAMAGRGDSGEAMRFILRLKKEEHMARVEFEDNGPGMDEETRKHVFDPFFTTKGVGTGTGLGLSVSYFIVTENHNGTMAVESTPGIGAKFIVRLPLQDRGN